MNQKPLCVAPFINLFYKGWDQKAKPCCEGNDEILIALNQKSSWQDVWGHSDIVKLRRQLLNGERPSYCQQCLSKENLGLANHRKQYLKKLSRINENIEFSDTIGNQFNAPLALDYRPSNVCNLKCRMCHPKNSSLFAKEALSYDPGSQVGFPNKDQLKILSRESGRDFFIEKVPGDKLVNLKLLGGEPVLSKDIVNFLKRQEEHLPQWHLEVTTNGTLYSEEFYQLVFKAKSAKINVSIDGVGKSYDYIRSPSNWTHFKKSWEHLSEKLCQKSRKYKVNLNFVLQIYNVFALKNVVDFFISQSLNSPHKENLDIFINTVDQAWLSPKLLTNNDLEGVKTSLNQQRKSWRNEPIAQDVIDKFLVGLSASKRPLQLDHKKFFDYTTHLDKVRNTNLENLDSRYAKYIKCGKESTSELQ